MANISALLEIIRTAHLGRDMRQALHDAIESVNNDTETALGKTLAFDDTTRKLTLKAKDNSVLSEATIPGGTSGSTVAWNQIKQSGEKIATITIDETTTDVYASAGGGGGGGAVDTVNGIAPDSNGNVTVDADHISDTSTTNKFVTATEKSTWNGKQDALTFTSTPSSRNKVVCVDDLPNGANKQDITSIVATGTTNNTGSTITKGQLFYLNGTLCKALSNIANGSAFTLNTNYAVKNLNDELADRPLKYKYVQSRYNSATTAGNTYIISNALSAMGLQSTDTVCGLVLASISGNSGENGGQAFYISFNDTIEFTPKSGNTSFAILNMVVFYN